ncbi:hypothetical protein Bbelb_440340 [Branchiostoma belcheri]|nr:hypothetical protein Bbelb_440340 [Branchiostoma belcheri]
MTEWLLYRPASLCLVRDRLVRAVMLLYRSQGREDERQLYPSTRGQRLNIALGKLPEHRVAFSTTRSPRQTINPNSDKDQFPLILAQPQTIHLPDPQIPGNDDVQRTRIFSVIRALEDDDKPDILGFEIFMKARTGFCAFASASLFVRQARGAPGTTRRTGFTELAITVSAHRVTWVRCNNAPCPATPDRSGSDMGTVPTLGRFRHWNPPRLRTTTRNNLCDESEEVEERRTGAKKTIRLESLEAAWTWS